MSFGTTPPDDDDEDDDAGLPSLDALNAKIARTHEQLKPKEIRDITDGAQGKGLAFALRLGAEFISGIMVGTAMGFFLDKWLTTSPIFLIIGALLGFAAGLKTMLATMAQAEKSQ